MNHFDPVFWLAVLGATALKLALSTTLNVVKVCVTVVAALLSAIFFTDPILHWMQWDPDVYQNAVAVKRRRAR